MTLDFVKKVLTIGGEGTPALQFYTRGFNITGGGTEPSWQDIILSGNTALTLVNAKANGLNYVKLFGATEQSNLPSGYTQKEYISNGSVNNYNTKLDTGVMPEVGDVLEIIFTPLKTDAVSNYLLQSRYGSSSTIFGISGSQSDASIMATWGGVSIKAQTIVRQVNHKYYIKASFLSTGTTLYIKDLTTNEEETRTAELGEGEPTANYWLFGNRGGQTLQAVYHTYLVRITNGNRVKLHYLPAVHNTAEGFYDLVTSTLKQSDIGRFYVTQTDATPSPDIPIDVKSNNGILKVSGNLLNRDDLEGGYLLTDEGQRGSSNNNWILTNFIKVKPNTSYIFDFVSGGDSVYRRVCGYSTNDYNSFTELLVKKQRPVTEGERFSELFTTSATTNYIKVSTYKADTNIQITEGTAAIPYRPYGEVYANDTIETVTDSLGNSATAEMLLNVTITNNYTDTQEILTGTITRNTAIKVLDGTESWVVNTGDYNFYRLNSAVNYSGSLVSGFYCTHFKPVSVASTSNNQGIRINSNSLFLRQDDLYPATSENLPLFKQWLANQYLNGTPVILVYPLATSTTETVTGQTLTTQAGTNTITATGYLDNLGLEISYKGT